jgi:pyruvate ferredoxin oxidoreductase alpha subunit
VDKVKFIGFWEWCPEDAEKVIVAAGSVCGTIKEVVDEQRKKGKKSAC